MPRESSTAHVVAADDCPTYRLATELLQYKALSTDTGGAYSLFETRTAPGQGIGPLRLRYEDEAFLVLEGEYALHLQGETVLMRPGDYAFVPRGTIHGITNTGSTTARMLILVSPGDIHEHYVTSAGELVDPGLEPAPAASIDMAHFYTLAAKYGVEILLPSSNVEG